MTTPRIYPDLPPDEPGLDRLGFWVRAVCGVLAGLGLGGWLWLRLLGLDSPFVGAILLVACVAGCTWGAVRHGDRFWIGLLRALAHR